MATEEKILTQSQINTVLAELKIQIDTLTQRTIDLSLERLRLEQENFVVREQNMKFSEQLHEYKTKIDKQTDSQQ